MVMVVWMCAAGIFLSGVVAQDTGVVTRADVTLYAVPDVRSAIVGHLAAQTAVTVDGRTEFAHWLSITLPDGVSGWIPSGSTILPEGVRLIDFAVLEALNGESTPPTTDDVALLDIIARLEATPLLHNLDTEAVQAIRARGREVGKRADVFTMIGDSNTTNGDFMRPLGLDANICDLGAYSYLQETVDFYSVPLRSDVSNSFVNNSIAAHKGLNSASALDPFWAISPLCEGNESPVMCEYRVSQPSIAIILLGQIDINYTREPLDFYRVNMEQIIQHSVESGVIPVLTTLVFLPERDEWATSIQYNGVLLDLAEQYQTPVINMWRAAQPLPGYGIGPDRSHLSARVGSFCAFTGAEQELGGTLRTLLTLQTLDLLRQDLTE
jgi:hypothetical protein